jgi:hypothetical protein
LRKEKIKEKRSIYASFHLIPKLLRIRIRQGKKFRINNTDVDVVQCVVAEVAEAVGESWEIRAHLLRTAGSSGGVQPPSGKGTQETGLLTKYIYTPRVPECPSPSGKWMN